MANFGPVNPYGWTCNSCDEPVVQMLDAGTPFPIYMCKDMHWPSVWLSAGNSSNLKRGMHSNRPCSWEHKGMSHYEWEQRINPYYKKEGTSIIVKIFVAIVILGIIGAFLG